MSKDDIINALVADMEMIANGRDMAGTFLSRDAIVCIAITAAYEANKEWAKS